LDDVGVFISETLGPYCSVVLSVLVPSGVRESVGDGETDFLAPVSDGVLDTFNGFDGVVPDPPVDDEVEIAVERPRGVDCNAGDELPPQLWCLLFELVPQA
jgi:hypothetical protein